MTMTSRGVLGRGIGAAALLLGGAVTALAQSAPPEAGEHQKSNESFFTTWMFALLLLPIVVTMILAAKRKKSRPSELTVFTDETFESDVVGSRVPVLVHFSAEWNVADRAALAQTEILRYMNRGAVTVGLLHVGDCPATMERFPGLETPAYLLFCEGRKLFHRPGLWQADDLQGHIDRALSQVGF